MKGMKIAQTISILFGCIGLLGTIKEAMDWQEGITAERLSCLILLLAAFVFLIFLMRKKTAVFRIANIFSAAGMIMIFLPIADDCLFSGDVPPASILLFGTPSALCVLAGVLAACKGITPASKELMIVAAVIRSFSAALYVSLLFSNIVYEDFGEEIMAYCPELSFAIMYINMAVYMHREVTGAEREPSGLG